MLGVRLKGVVLRYGEEVVLSFPDLELAPGEQVAVVGPSGSGKTSLLHLLAGLRRPDRGEVVVGGRDLAALGEAERDAYRRRSVGYLFQDFHLMEGYTALENVLLGLGVAGVRGKEAVERAASLLRELGLEHRLAHPPRRLSTGERQRVALARAVAHRPGLLLADEPTAHLDRARAQAALEFLLGTAARLGATLVVATHDPGVVQALPRRVVLGEEGRGV